LVCERARAWVVVARRGRASQRSRVVHLTFRAKLMAVVGAAATAFLLVILVSALIGAREARQLADIEGRLVPKLALGPKLEADFETLRRGMQDAVAAQDLERLAEVRVARDGVLATLDSAQGLLDPKGLANVHDAIEDYYRSAFEVSRRLIANDIGESSVSIMAAMQDKQNRVISLLKQTTHLDRSELTAGFAAARAASQTAAELRLWIGLGCLVVVLALSIGLSRGLLARLAQFSVGLARFGQGDFTKLMPVTTEDELGSLAKEANQMAHNLGRLAAERDRNDWLRIGHSKLANELRGDLEAREIARRSLALLASYIDAPAGALYIAVDADHLQLTSQYAGSRAGGQPEATSILRVGEGLVGRAALQSDVVIIEDPPADYARIRSERGEGSPRAIVLLPLVHLGKVTGVLELALSKPCSEVVRDLLTSVRETLAIALEVARARTTMRELLMETSRQAKRLTHQEEELKASNEELQVQQRDLRLANEELERQRHILEEKNVELEGSRLREQEKAEALAEASAYKSQFLSNMSHELRTPLNSMLLLSNLLAENVERNLTDKQVEFSRTIHSAGKDLLTLINQVLDLAKIESGKQEIFVETVMLADVAQRARRVFTPLAADKHLGFAVEVDSTLPATIATDRQRVDQILTNLLGNAIKFTQQGQVTLRISRPGADARLLRADVTIDRTIAFAVSDTGIGIAAHEQERVFTPFQQIDGRTDRRYGGTGLGLSIAREMAALLGGELQLESTPGKGSTFTCYLPAESGLPAHTSGFLDMVLAEPPSAEDRRAPAEPGAARAQGDDRALIAPDEPHLLVIEDDPHFAQHVVDIIHARHFKAILASNGRQGLELAKKHRPQGIILDVKLPDIDGWTVMEHLGFDADTRRIPVHFVSALHAPQRGLAMGAVGYLTKPATREEIIRVVEILAPQTVERSRRILVIEDDTDQGGKLVERLEGEGLQVRFVQSGGAALEVLEYDRFSCIVLDLGLPDVDGLGLLELLRARTDVEMPPIVVFTGRSLTKDETRRIEDYAQAVVLKEGRSTERLLGEIRTFIEHVKERLPAGPAPVTPSPPVNAVRLGGKKILLVDDDMRTVYALAALLRAKGAEVLAADNGREALTLLGEHPDASGVLMDVMMPEMDGYEAMRRIRQDARFVRLPVIALTAKAMQGEREKCLAAGASDYLTKPIDAEHLLAMLQLWLGQGEVATLAG
jgi:CheY-like chemotaxis protein/signal transduction histidine kinase/HAMP domain-containing protein